MPFPPAAPHPVPPPYPGGWPAGALPSAAIGEAGLVLGAGTVLAPMGGRRELALDPERALALLSVAAGRPVPARVPEGIAAAAGHWRRGDAALANLRLVFAGLPRLEEPQALHKLQAADWLLGNGLTPRALMRELGLDASALDAVSSGDLGKYNPDQPRVPAGNGIESGRWSGTWGDGAFGLARPNGGVQASQIQFDHVDYAANNLFTPGGTITYHTDSANPLDPKNLNRYPPTIEEQKAIADTVENKFTGTKRQIRRMRIQPYDNRPHNQTGAVLPNRIQRYEERAVGTPGLLSRGERRLIISEIDGSMYYTKNHYKSFYRVRLVPSKK